MGKKSNPCCLNLKESHSLFKALGDLNRVSILDHLCKCQGEALNVGDISSCCDVDLSVVSRHLSTLKNAGVLHSEKKGKEVFYSINAKELVKSLRSIADFVEKCNCEPRRKT